MKKRVKSKSKKRKVAKTEASSPSIDVEQDIAVLLTTLVQRLASFETKLDAILNRVMSQPNEAARKPQPPVVSSNEPRRERERGHGNNYTAICAQCGQDCEVPFRPSGNRPVYCRGCFAQRKYKENYKPREERRPQAGAALSLRQSAQPSVSKPADPPEKRKPAVKKSTKKTVKPAKKKKAAAKKSAKKPAAKKKVKKAAKKKR
jgi:CxxC-x17-CxxC domain-containing protein